MPTDRVDWAVSMRLGLGALRLPPDVFWAMSPIEFQLALEGAGLIAIGGQPAFGRETLETLMDAYPDATPSI
ncbi:MAG: rcc01693 family protein [Pseudomonadota bacterium]